MNEPTKVVVTDVQIRFTSLLVLMIKVMLALIPAALIATIAVMAFVWAIGAQWK
jgi:hypothetical protein